MTAVGNRSSLRAILVAGAASIVGALPMFVTGAMAVQISEDLAFGTAALGGAIAVFPATSAVAVGFMGRLADRLGSTWSLRLAVTVAGCAAIGIATTATSWLTLVAWLMVGSCARALAQPAANRMVVNNVRPERQGAAFGLKQSSAPAASMLAGLAVPAVALTLGWRWAYVFTGMLAVVVVFAIGRRTPVARRTPRRARARGRLRNPRTILLLAVAFGFGNVASATVPAFYVVSAVRAGSSAQFAGMLLASASLASIVIRLVSGVACDRLATGHLRLCAALLAAGSLGLGLLALGRPAPMAAGAIIALAGTWGFPAVFWFAVVRAYRDAPGRITGAILPGGLIGATIGPLLFGVVAEQVSYAAAWVLPGLLSLFGAAALLYGARRLVEPAAPAPVGAAATPPGGPAPAGIAPPGAAKQHRSTG